MTGPTWTCCDGNRARPRTPPSSCSRRSRRPARSMASSRRASPTTAARSRGADGGGFDGGRGGTRRTLALLVVSRRAGVYRIPRRSLGPPHARRPRALRDARPRVVSVGTFLAYDPAQARGLPARLRGLGHRENRRLWGARRRAAPRGLPDCAPPRQDRGRDRERRRDAGLARARRDPRRTLVGLRAGVRRRGFRFVGPTTAYALMQAAGMVNDHLKGCELR